MFFFSFSLPFKREEEEEEDDEEDKEDTGEMDAKRQRGTSSEGVTDMRGHRTEEVSDRPHDILPREEEVRGGGRVCSAKPQVDAMGRS